MNRNLQKKYAEKKIAFFLKAFVLLNPLYCAYVQSADQQLEEYVITAPKIQGSVSSLIQDRKNSNAVADVLGSEQMAKSGDSDAGASLRRVTGLTLVRGKFVYVRGLGERYSAVTLNGLSIPSPEPSRRVVPLDLFPASLLESVIVQKSFSPQLPGEFGGGLIELKTKSLPDKTFFKATVSTNSDLLEPHLSYSGGKKDWMGIDDGTRRLPHDVFKTLSQGKKIISNNPPAVVDGVTPEELIKLGLSMPNNYSVQKGKTTPIPGLALSFGRPYLLGAFKSGFSVAGLHSTGGEARTVGGKTLNAINQTEFAVGETSTSLVSEIERKSALGAETGISWKDQQKINFNILLVRHSSDESKIKNSSNPADSFEHKRSTSITWTEREVLAKQVSGSHELMTFSKEPVLVEWKLQVAKAGLNIPDHREYTYVERSENVFTLLEDTTGNLRTWTDLIDSSEEGRFDLTLPVHGTLGNLQLKIGGTFQQRKRRSDTFRFQFLGDSTIDYSKTPEEIFSPTNINNRSMELTNITDVADSYSGVQNYNAIYAGAEWSPVESWTLSTGVRYEKSKQNVNTFKYFSPDQSESHSTLEMFDVLPAHALTFKPIDQIRGRLSYSESLARPEFREISSLQFIDDESGYEAHGNPSLKGTVIQNIDHRWEYYPSSEEAFSLGVFWKKFRSPIEEVFEPSPNLMKTYANAESAQNFGLEVEGRVALRRMDRFFRRFTLASNLSIIRSRVKLGAEASGLQTSQVRPLQGQSPWVSNIQLFYDHQKSGIQLSILYNAVGPRITEVGTGFRPDTYEEPFHQLDFIAGQKIGKSFQLSFRAKNLLNPEAQSTQGSEIVKRYSKGRSYYAAITQTF